MNFYLQIIVKHLNDIKDRNKFVILHRYTCIPVIADKFTKVSGRIIPKEIGFDSLCHLAPNVIECDVTLAICGHIM